MCGICGITYFDRNRSVDQKTLKKMADVMIHRGPDDEGYTLQGSTGFGHRRLSIIDLEGGHQPMSNRDGSIWITYGGEIYNYLELRQDLIAKGRSFKTHSDTEVILRLYEEKGIDCLQDLNGMFSFAILDKNQNRLFCVRDRFGIKPFYFYSDARQFVFASEIKSILQVPDVPNIPNLDEIKNYLTFQFSLGEGTFFSKIQKLLPGHFLLLDLKLGASPKIVKYWDLDFEPLQNRSEEDYSDELLSRLKDTVKLQLRSDVPLGSHLSGGLDSTFVSCLTTQILGKNIKTFTGTFRNEGSDFDESSFAKLASTAMGSQYHEVVPTPQDFIEYLPKLVYHLDEPAAGPGVFPQYMVSRLASQHVKVVLGGQGGDELYGGYVRYLIAYLEECLRGAIYETQKSEDKRFVVTFESILPNLPTLREYIPLLRQFFAEDFFGPADQRYFRLINRGEGIKSLFEPSFLQNQSGVTPFESFKAVFNDLPQGALINRMTHFDIKSILPALLHVEDRVSMACSLESRVPLLDHRVAEFMATVPPVFKFKGGQTKHLFREAIKTIVPPQILNRKDKKGFPVPLTEWMKGPLKDFVRETLLGKKARSRGIYSIPEIEKKLTHEEKFGRQTWALLNLELWFQQFQDQSPPPHFERPLH